MVYLARLQMKSYPANGAALMQESVIAMATGALFPPGAIREAPEDNAQN